MYDLTIRDFGPTAVGQRVELHPATDRWLRGDRFGTVIAVGRTNVRVHMDRTGSTISVAPRNVGRFLD